MPESGPPSAAHMNQRLIGWVYAFIILLMALTGFGQMPIYRRYYVSDIPGLGWLADFWITRYVHYVGAVLLLALLAYAVVEYAGLRRKHARLTTTGWLRLGLLGLIVVTGVMFVIKNFAVYVFSPGMIVFLDLVHLGSVAAFLMLGLYCLVFKKRWTSPR